MMLVRIPAGVFPGQPFQIATPNGAMQVVAPPGTAPGQTMRVNVPAPAQQAMAPWNPPPPPMAAPVLPPVATPVGPASMHPGGGMGGMGTIHVDHAPASGCCEQMCCGGQPDKRGGVKIFIDGVDKHSIKQGQSSSFMVPAGPHQVEAKYSGFFNRVFGGGRVGSHAVVVAPGGQARFTIHWVPNGEGSWVARLDHAH